MMPSNPAIRKGKPGAPLGNTNAARHYLTVPGGKLPHDLQYIERKRNQFRRQLRAIVAECRPDLEIGEQTEVEATILTACGWLEDRMKIQRYIRVKGDGLSPAETIKCWEQEAKALEKIEAAIKRIGLRVDPAPLGLAEYLETTAKRIEREAAS